MLTRSMNACALRPRAPWARIRDAAGRGAALVTRTGDQRRPDNAL